MPVSTPACSQDLFSGCFVVPGTRRLQSRRQFRCDGPLLFFNVDYVHDQFFELLTQRGEAVKLAILFLGTTPAIDLAGAELLADLHHTLKVGASHFTWPKLTAAFATRLSARITPITVERSRLTRPWPR